MDVRFLLTLLLWALIMAACGAVGYAATGSMRFVAGYLNYLTAPLGLMLAGYIAYELPCQSDCPLRRQV